MRPWDVTPFDTLFLLHTKIQMQARPSSNLDKTCTLCSGMRSLGSAFGWGTLLKVCFGWVILGVLCVLLGKAVTYLSRMPHAHTPVQRAIRRQSRTTNTSGGPHYCLLDTADQRPKAHEAVVLHHFDAQVLRPSRDRLCGARHSDLNPRAGVFLWLFACMCIWVLACIFMCICAGACTCVWVGVGWRVHVCAYLP